MIFADDDTTPHPGLCCGLEPHSVYGPVSVISCPKCNGEITVETAPFFRDVATQREHEAWRAAAIWNETKTRTE
jgi:hypothetical protein